jgi:hypothetical protein
LKSEISQGIGIVGVLKGIEIGLEVEDSAEVSLNAA